MATYKFYDIFEESRHSVVYKKELFVRHKLLPLILELDAEVESIEFIYNYRTEHLRITYKTGRIRDIEVTSMSRRQITIAAINAI